MKEKSRFGAYLKKLRKEKGISQKQLCDGLCTTVVLRRYERGERIANKLLQNRLLTRLGAVPENYENFLFYDDYCHWEKRQEIVHFILEENMEQAEEKLEAYHSLYSMKNPLEKQFYLAMLAQIRRYEGCKRDELSDLFGRALLLTVPDVENRGFEERVMSLEEINLLLEYIYCSELGKFLKSYQDIIRYIEKVNRTQLAMAKIFPKAVYYYFEEWDKKKDKTEYEIRKMLTLCNRAIDILRNANRMFYLWELLKAKEKIIRYFPISDEFEKDYLECKEWRLTLEAIYRECGVTIKMYEYCYLYIESENYCIGDVVRIRRKMLGMTMEELCEGICYTRTISRLERNKTKVQWEVLMQLMKRLNLAAEFCRTELVTESQEAKEKYDDLRVHNINQNYYQVENLLKEIENIISLHIASNRQAIMRNRLINQINAGIITKSEYVERMIEVLEYTISYEAVLKCNRIYLTNEEIACVQNIMVKLDDDFPEKELYAKILVKLCEQQRFPSNYVRVYEFIMAAVSSYVGNKGQYDESNRIKRNIVYLSLINRRIGAIHGALYGMMWNMEQISKKGNFNDVTEKKKCMLVQCINMSKIAKDFYRMNAYQEKLEKLLNNEEYPENI